MRVEKSGILTSLPSVYRAAFCVCLLGLAGAAAAQLPEWTEAIRADHPRLFFNPETWPAVRERALGAEGERYAHLERECTRLAASLATPPDPPRDLGVQAAKAAFVYRVNGDPAMRELALACLGQSLDFYDLCFAEKRAVNWYSTTRVHAAMAWDWLYEDLSPEQRQGLFERLVDAVDRVLEARPRIHRENYSTYKTGFYGIQNCCWFLGCTGFGTGYRQDKVNEWLTWGHAENMRLLNYRKQACGDDGGSASPTLGYAFGAYPWAEQNFLYTWLSATGENIAPQWRHSAWLANYVIWNWIPGTEEPLGFGYGDTPHTTNRLPIYQLYSHMANVRHLFGADLPVAASLARRVQQMLPEPQQTHSGSWFIYPYLLTGAETDGPPLELETLPKARNFATMGQVFMRSGTEVNDTYALFTCGGILAQHRHYDALNLVIVHRGAHLALDSGTRYREFDNGQHLANYFAQTVAHNCVLIHQPGEPPARYWGGKVSGNHGGQHRHLGSELLAFQTTDRFVYLAGDATACYQHGPAKDAEGNDLPEKCSEVTRQVLFLLPDVFVVFDRFTATSAEYRKEWLLHTAHEPQIQGNLTQADFRGARLFCRTLLPAAATLQKVGGPGREFLAAGSNWSLVDEGLKPEQKAMMGQWRLEVSPTEAAERDVFLHVLAVAPDDQAVMPATTLLRSAERAGVQISHNGTTWTVAFNESGPLGGSLQAADDAGRLLLDQPLTQEVTPQVGVLARPE